MPQKTIFDDLFIFTGPQLSELISDAIDSFVESADNWDDSDAKDAVVIETILSLECERSLANTEPGYIVTNQVIPVATEVTQS